jgi:hypothetical protein
MVTTIEDYDEKVIAYMEWSTVGPSGYPKPYGDHLFVNEVWVHRDFRSKGLLQEIILKVISLVPYVKFGYFTRRKYGGRVSKLYTREQFMKHLQIKEGVV